MFELIHKKLLLFLLFAAFVNSDETVENGGYNALVSFSRDIASEGRIELLDKMMESLIEASEILYTATGRRFTKVTFKIPSSWDASGLNITTSFNLNLSKSDFLISSTNDLVFGKLPFAQQYGGCGVPGRQIVIPTDFFDEANPYPKGTALAREWLKYRYGVFDENGFVEDDMYPLIYSTASDPTEIKITDCTNEPVTYNFFDDQNVTCSDSNKTLKDRLKSGECKVKPEVEDLNIDSSLMYFQKEISTAKHICGKDEDHVHNSQSPSKQNVLCDGQSVWEVVEKSPDFSNEITGNQSSETEFVFVQDGKPKVVVAWENNQKLTNKKEVILKAIKKFIIDLPDGSKFSGFPFKSTPQDDFPLKELDKESRPIVMMAIHSSFTVSEKENINVAIDKALDIMAGETDGDIIVITRGSETITEEIKKKLTDARACVRILYFSEGAIPEEITNYVSALPCGKLEEFPVTDSNETTFENLINSMGTVIPAAEDGNVTQTVTVTQISHESPIIFDVDNYVESVTFWIVDKEETGNFVMKFNESLTVVNRTTEVIESILMITYELQSSGNIRFEYIPTASNKMLTQVTVTSKQGQDFAGDVIVVDTTTPANSTEQMPVIIYAFIRFGSYPVQNAKVTAEVRGPNETLEVQSLEMYDDGKGDPDITRFDGVYSRYFTKFTEEGDYTVTVTVTNNGHETTFGADESADYQTCCGSNLKNEIETTRLNKFSKTFRSVFTARGRRPDSGYKPLKIRDLRISEITEDKITLKWTAPGGEADEGTALKYEIKMYCGEEKITECDIHKVAKVIDQSLPLSYGKEQQATLQIITSTEILSVGITTENTNNIYSDLSNIVEIFQPNKTVTTAKPETAKQEAISKGTIIGIAIAVLLIIACVAIGSIFYIRRESKRKAKEAYEIGENTNSQHIEISFPTTMNNTPVKKNESFPVLLYSHNQIKDIKDKSKDPPLYKDNIPPKMWSSLGAIPSTKTGEGSRDTKSLGSTSTVHDIDGAERNDNDVDVKAQNE